MARSSKQLVIGQLDRFISLYDNVESKSVTTNAPTHALTKIKDVWSQRVDTSGSEEFEEKVYSLNNRQYAIHYDPDITAKILQRLVIRDEDEDYYVFAYELIGRAKYILLKAALNE